ncbi:MAG TPA: dihydropteroate synthase [Gemmatimonadales bacterium]
MIVTALSGRATAVRDALLSHGWEGDLARLTAAGLDVGAMHVTGISGEIVEEMLPLAARLGLELITGDDWLILVGAHSRLGAFARPWMQPEPLRELATAVGLALPPERDHQWRHARGVIAVDRAVIVGVINVTPDSFSDGAPLSVDDALRRTDELLADGATLIDIGGESTRPGAEPVTVETEQLRILPVLAAVALRHPSLPLSVDTVHAPTAEAAIGAGATIINDVTAGRHDPALLAAAAGHRVGLVLSHSRGRLGRLASYDHAEYHGDVTAAVAGELRVAIDAAITAGVAPGAVVVDPGFGFSKTPMQSLALLDHLATIVSLGPPVLVGVSRKRFLGEATGRAVDDRDRATAAACVLAYERGARLFRVHAPAAVRDALAVAQAVSEAGPA